MIHTFKKTTLIYFESQWKKIAHLSILINFKQNIFLKKYIYFIISINIILFGKFRKKKTSKYIKK